MSTLCWHDLIWIQVQVERFFIFQIYISKHDYILYVKNMIKILEGNNCIVNNNNNNNNTYQTIQIIGWVKCKVGISFPQTFAQEGALLMKIPLKNANNINNTHHSYYKL